MAALVTELPQVRELIANLFERPFRAISFNIDNQTFEEYEAKEVIYGDSLPQFGKALRQWKKQCNPEFFERVLVPVVASSLTTAIMSGLAKNKAVSLQDKKTVGGVNILGALYIEKVLREFKKFLQFLISNPAHSSLCTKMLQVASVLTADCLEEAEEITQQANAQNRGATSETSLNLKETRMLFNLRVDSGS